MIARVYKVFNIDALLTLNFSCDLNSDLNLDVLMLLFCVHYTYNYDYKVQRNAMIFLEKASFGVDLHAKLPLTVTQTIKLLGQ
jgi:hypothetical protein